MRSMGWCLVNWPDGPQAEETLGERKPWESAMACCVQNFGRKVQKIVLETGGWNNAAEMQTLKSRS